MTNALIAYHRCSGVSHEDSTSEQGQLTKSDEMERRSPDGCGVRSQVIDCSGHKQSEMQLTMKQEQAITNRMHRESRLDFGVLPFGRLTADYPHLARCAAAIFRGTAAEMLRFGLVSLTLV
jgi:hypothetical protein